MKKGLIQLLLFSIYFGLQAQAASLFYFDGTVSCSSSLDPNLSLNFIYKWDKDYAPINQKFYCDETKKKIEEGLKEPIKQSSDIVHDIKMIPGGGQSFYGKSLCACLDDQEGLTEADFNKVMGYIDSPEMLQLEANDLGFRHRAALDAINDFQKDPGDLVGRYSDIDCESGISPEDELPVSCKVLKGSNQAEFEKIEHAILKGSNQGAGNDQAEHDLNLSEKVDRINRGKLDLVDNIAKAALKGSTLAVAAMSYMSQSKENKDKRVDAKTQEAMNSLTDTPKEGEEKLVSLLLEYNKLKRETHNETKMAQLIKLINKQLYSVKLISYPYSTNQESKTPEYEVYRFLSDLDFWEKKYEKNPDYLSNGSYKEADALKNMLFHLKDMNRHNAGKFCASIKVKVSDLCNRALKPQRAQIDFDRYFTPLVKSELGENKSALVAYDKTGEDEKADPSIENTNLSDAAATSNLLSLFPMTAEGQKLKLKMLKSACYKINDKSMPDFMKAKDLYKGEPSQKIKSLGAIEDKAELAEPTDKLLQKEGAAITAKEGLAEKQKVETEEKQKIDAVVKASQASGTQLVPKTSSGEVLPEHKAAAEYVQGFQKSGFNLDPSYQYIPQTNQFSVNGDYYDATTGEKTKARAIPVEEPVIAGQPMEKSSSDKAVNDLAQKIEPASSEKIDLNPTPAEAVYASNAQAFNQAAPAEVRQAIQEDIKGIAKDKEKVLFNLTRRTEAKTDLEKQEAQSALSAAEKSLRVREERLAQQISKLVDENEALRNELKSKGFVDSVDQKIANDRARAQSNSGLSGANYQNRNNPSSEGSFNRTPVRQVASLSGASAPASNYSKGDDIGASRSRESDFYEAVGDGKVNLTKIINYDFTDPDAAKVQASKEQLQKMGLTDEDQKLIDNFTGSVDSGNAYIYEVDTEEGKKSVLIMVPESQGSMGYYQRYLNMPQVIDIKRTKYSDLTEALAPAIREPATKGLGEQP
jgi:hypothetical protein